MKITETYTSNKITKSNRKKFSSAAGGFEELLEVNEAMENTGAASLGSMSGVVSLSSFSLLTGMDDDILKKQQNINWGKEALDTLRTLRDAMVYGRVSYTTLQRLEEQLNNLPYESADPKLKEIIDGIKVRAAVEVEKLKK
ncbi:MAG TPA: hypothetical protein DIV86_00935 [Alphaproteobacteria bacterium]|nr:hypothetical protein [Alphaproteobacteria bacterium]